MGVFWSILWVSATLFPFCFLHSTQGQPSQIVKNSTTTLLSRLGDIGNLTNYPILRRHLPGFGSISCGFHCSFYPNCNAYLFGVYALSESSSGLPRSLWSSNRDKPVRMNATLLLTGNGDLILKDFDGTLVWSSNTKGKSVAGLNLTEPGNLVIFDTNNSVVWQSSDLPTDTLLQGNKLYPGQKLTSSNSSTNFSQGLYSLSVTNEDVFASIESGPSLVYYNMFTTDYENPLYALFINGSFTLFFKRLHENETDTRLIGSSFPPGNSWQHLRLDFDGHLRVYDPTATGWEVVADILTTEIGNCGYPLACGNYGICSTSEDGSPICSCPQSADNTNSSYFKQISDRYPNLGCSEINPLSCDNSKSKELIGLKNINHKTATLPDVENTDRKSCEQSCLDNCSCKAAIFKPSYNGCYLLPTVFAMENIESDLDNDINFFLKVQNDSSVATATPTDRRKTSKNLIILGWTVGAFSGFLLIIGVFIFLSRKNKYADDLEEDYLDQLPGMPKRYSYEDLIAATEDFNKKLGQGGFGSVFEGTLINGTMVAVKRLDGLGRIKDSFLSEVQTIGSIHHVNLVRLIGYCNNKSHRLLVYEYMCNGSLDKWIFRGSQEYSALDWRTRRMIILDIAKGLAYLHDGCRQKILHLDIKPQNILLDANFRAKVSDFGLSKLIDRDQSQVITIMKGTPGYMAPEWLNSVITEKVDVYSFGVVVLEILCGRRNLDRSQPEEDMHLLSLFKRKAEEDELLDLIDKNSEDMVSNGAEMIKMMKVAAWCLQSDSAKRPSMFAVVKLLEGSLDDVEEINLEYDFSFPRVSRGTPILGHNNGGFVVPTPVLPSTLSGPR